MNVRLLPIVSRLLVGTAALTLVVAANGQKSFGPELTSFGDQAGGSTNEVVLRLNYGAKGALMRLSPQLADSMPQDQIEALVIRAINEGQSQDLRAISSRASARFLLNQNRMTADERARRSAA